MFGKILKYISAFLSMVICFAGSHGYWSNQVDSLNSIQKVADGFYTMDYTYDYDIDEILEKGFSTHVQLVVEGAMNVLTDYKGFGCTTFNSVNKEGEYLFSRNFDYMDSPYLLVWTHPENGYKSISSVSLYFLMYNDKFLPEDQFTGLLTLLAPYCPLDGINEKGLSIGVLELEKDPVFQMTSKPNLTTTTMIRAVLDKAATVDEAIQIFDSYDMRDYLFGECTYHYQIADAQGNSAVIEYVNGKMKVIYPEKNSENKVDYISAANYYITEGVDDPLALGFERTAIVNDCLSRRKGVTSENIAMKVLKKASMKNEDMNGYICSTLWSAVFNTHDLTMDVCAFRDYKNVYSFSVNQPQVILNK